MLFVSSAAGSHSHSPLRGAVHSRQKHTHHKEQIHVVQSQALQALVQAQLHARCVRRPHLAHDKDFLALDDARVDRGLDALSDLVLVAVAVRPVNEPVPVLQGVLDGRGDLAGAGLPCACDVGLAG